MAEPKPTTVKAPDKDAATFTAAPEITELEAQLKAKEEELQRKMKELQRKEAELEKASRPKTITIGRDSTMDDLRNKGFLVSSNQNPRPRDRKIMIAEGWKRLSVLNGEVVEDSDGVWAIAPKPRPDGLLDRSRPFRSHRAQTGRVHEQDGRYYNDKGVPINKPAWL